MRDLKLSSYQKEIPYSVVVVETGILSCSNASGVTLSTSCSNASGSNFYYITCASPLIGGIVSRSLNERQLFWHALQQTKVHAEAYIFAYTKNLRDVNLRRQKDRSNHKMVYTSDFLLSIALPTPTSPQFTHLDTCKDRR